jgi:hypothetical protein
MQDYVIFDPLVIDVVSTATFWLALGPITYLVLARKDVGFAFWVFAVAYLTSLGGDAIGTLDRFAGLSEGRWLNTHVWPPVMFAVIAGVVIRDQVRWWLAIAVIALAAWVDARGGVGHPGWMATVAGMAIVVGALYLAREPGPLTVPLLVFYGLGSLLYLGYALLWERYYVSTSFWYAYQGARLGAFGLFARAAWRADA